MLLAGRPDKDHLLDSSGGGAAFLDYDRDGRLDVYLVNGWRLDGSRVVERGKNALYHGLPDGTFEDVTDAAGVGGEGQWGQGVAVADYDNDGWPDILVTNFGRNVLYRNLGNGRFQDVAKEVGIESPGWNTGAAFFDADGDGYLDLYVASYIDVTLEQVLGRAALALLARPRDGGVRTVRPQGRARSLLPQRRRQALRGRHGRGGDGGQGAGLRLRRARRRLQRRRPDRPLRRQRLRPQLPLPERGRRRLQGGRHLVGGRSRRERRGPGEHGPRRGRRGRRRRPRPLHHELLRGLLDALPRPRRRAVRGRLEGERRRAPRPSSRCRGARRSPTSTTTATSTSLVANGHIYPQIDRHPELIGTYAQKNLLLENREPAGRSRSFAT